MKKHIFFLFSDFGLGGIQRKMVDLVNIAGRSKNYNDITIHFFIRFSSKFSFEKKIKNKNIIIHRIPNSGFLYLWYLLQATASYKPATIVLFLHYHLLHIFFLMCIPFIKKPKIILSQDVPLNFENKKIFSQREYPNWILKILYKIPNHIISPTRYIAKELSHIYGVNKKYITIIPNWLVTPIKPPSKKTIDIIYCGRFDKQKQLHVLLEIVRHVKETIPTLTVHLIGEGEEIKKILSLIDIYKLKSTVTVLPATHEVRNYIGKAKLFLLTSAFEGFPMVLLEAISGECTPIILSYPGVHEYIRHKKTGYIETDNKHMVKRIIQLLTNEKQRITLANKARKEVLSRYGKSHVLRTLSYL